MDNQRLRVLLIEDDEDDYLLTRDKLRRLESPRFEIAWVNTYDAGLEALARGEHDVALVDYRLGVRDGLELLREAVANGCRMPIIMLTGLDNREADVRAMEAGAADFLDKNDLSARLLERSIRYAIERRRAEERLRVSEERFRVSFEQAAVGVTQTDMQGRYIRVNHKFCDIVGYTREELLARTWQEITHPDDLELDLEQTRQLTAGQIDTFSIEERCVRKDGSPVRVNVTISLARPVTGEPDYFISVIDDITARKQIEQQLAESEARYRAMNDASPLGIFLTDADGACIYTNRMFHQMSGLTFEEALGNGWGTIIYPEDRDRVFSEWYASVQNGAPYDSVHRLQRKDGRIIWTHVKAAEVRTGERLLGYLGTVDDITERKRVEDALMAERNLLRTLVDALPDFIFVKDAEGRFVLSNTAHARAAQAASPEALVGKTAFDFWPPELAAQYDADDRAIMQSGEPLVNAERQTVDAAGGRILVSTTKVPLRDKDGAVVGLVGISRDITASKEAEKNRMELELQREKVNMIQRFIGDASHDLRTPLTIMTTSLYLLRRSTVDKRQLGYIENLEQQIARVQQLVEDLFTLSRLDMAASEFQLAPSDLNALTQLVCEQQRPLAERKRHELTLVLDDQLPRVMLNESEFAPALRHLIVNAINYTPDGGQISVTTRAEDRQAIIEVRDNGIGISAEDQPLIFERFYRADKARNINTGGSGLGLTITQKIVEVHGGRIEVESAPGAGSVFRVALPLP